MNPNEKELELIEMEEWDSYCCQQCYDIDHSGGK